MHYCWEQRAQQEHQAAPAPRRKSRNKKRKEAKDDKNSEGNIFSIVVRIPSLCLALPRELSLIKSAAVRAFLFSKKKTKLAAATKANTVAYAKRLEGMSAEGEAEELLSSCVCVERLPNSALGGGGNEC